MALGSGGCKQLAQTSRGVGFDIERQCLPLRNLWKLTQFVPVGTLVHVGSI
jgi:hypothetical protein